jgi:hypothetical protein
MADESITCPKCNAKIPLSKALAGQVEERVRKHVEAEIAAREAELEEQFEEKLADERKAAATKAKREMKVEVTALHAELAEKQTLLEATEKKELALLKVKSDLEAKQKRVELDVARKVEEATKEIEDRLSAQFSEAHSLKDKEKEKQLGDLRAQIEELKRKAAQGSQQTQGEVAELELEAALTAAFPYDTIEAIAKGVKGADLLQTVRTHNGQVCGTITWEFKNTKTWSDGWIAKLRDDQRARKADLAVLVSVAMPQGMKHFAQREGIWVCEFQLCVCLASALRATLAEVAGVRVASEGKTGKMELMYSYLSGVEFRQRVEAMLEGVMAMKQELDRERRALENIWSKREKTILRIGKNVAGMYGDLQGIAGASLADIEALSLPAETADADLLTS